MPKMNSMAEILEEVRKLREAKQGWVFIPADDPEHASFGVRAFRSVKGEYDEEIHYEWLPFGRRLEPNITIARDADQFRHLVDDLRPLGILRCDDSKRLLTGFVSYDGERGVARIVRIPLTRLHDENFDKRLRMEIQIGSAIRMNTDHTMDLLVAPLRELANGGAPVYATTSALDPLSAELALEIEEAKKDPAYSIAVNRT